MFRVIYRKKCFVIIVGAILFSSVLLSSFHSFAHQLVYATGQPYAAGDVDGNGEVEAADARLALRASVQLEHYVEDSAPFSAADVNEDGMIESSDARMILRASVGLEQLSKMGNRIRSINVYIPERETWNVWDDMQNEHVYSGSAASFKDSVNADIEWKSDAEYQVLKINDTVYLSSPEANQFFVGRRKAEDRQYWVNASGALKDALANELLAGRDIAELLPLGYYAPNQEHWSVWLDMPENSVYTGSAGPFKDSVDADIEWKIDTEYQVLKIRNMVIVSSPVAGHFYVGQQNELDGTQMWIPLFQQTQENTYITEHYENTYLLNGDVIISTDANYYLASPGNQSDMTGPIQTMLLKNKTCQLGPGDFYVSGITIPKYGMLRGCGTATRLILMDSVETGYAVQLSSYSCVKDMQIMGAISAFEPIDPIGSRHGILFEGLADSGGNVPYCATVENVTVKNFSGGAITCYNTGYSTSASLNVSDCFLSRCGAGIHIPYFSEYHKFSNVSVTNCTYGCVNNGGNNMFSNCGFNGNKVGLLMDNRQNQSPNSSHGSFVGCTFNHSDGNNGYAIKILGMNNGEIFNSCQIFFGKTLIKGCKGIQFIGSNMGRNTDIEISDSSSVIFSNCIMNKAADTPVTVQNSTNVLFVNCYCKNGSLFTGNLA